MKANLIKELRNLIAPDNRPETLVFRSIKGTELYSHAEKQLTREQCLKMPAKMRIFVNRKIVKHGEQV